MTGHERTELAELRDTVHAGFARMDRYFELQQAQFVDFRTEVRGDIRELRGEMQELRGELQELRRELQELTRRVDRIEERLASLEHEVRSLRDWATREFADVRLELRRLRDDVMARDEERRHADDVGRDNALRPDVDALAERVARLERLAEG